MWAVYFVFLRLYFFPSFTAAIVARSNHPEGLLKSRLLGSIPGLLIQRVWAGLEIYISDKFSGDAAATDPGPHGDKLSYV